MSLLDDAKELAELPPMYGHEISSNFCKNTIEHHEDCHCCDAPLVGPNREKLGEHAPNCPWLSMPKIVAALEIAKRIAEAPSGDVWGDVQRLGDLLR